MLPILCYLPSYTCIDWYDDLKALPLRRIWPRLNSFTFYYCSKLNIAYEKGRDLHYWDFFSMTFHCCLQPFQLRGHFFFTAPKLLKLLAHLIHKLIKNLILLQKPVLLISQKSILPKEKEGICFTWASHGWELHLLSSPFQLRRHFFFALF